MAVKQALQKKAAEQAVSPKKNLRQAITAMLPEIEKALPSVVTPERFTRMVLSAVSVTPELANCTQDSFLAAMMNAAQLGLEPNTPLGQAYLIPYKNYKKQVTECQFQIGYKGLIDLAHRSGEFKSIDARVVYEGDEFEYEYGLEPKLLHKPARANRGQPVFYYGVYTLVNGGFGFEVMSVEDVREHRKKFSKAKNSPWDTNFDEMAKKTVLKRVLKYAPIKTEFAKQVVSDSTIKTTIAEDMSEIPDETDWESLKEVDVEVVEEPEAPADFVPIPEEGLPFETDPENK